MPKVIYHGLDGIRNEVEVAVGNTVMEGAIDNDIDGIVAECGGACACATCHSYIADDWLARVKLMDDMEDAMLDSALDRKDSSRLTCQIEMTAEMDGLEVIVADPQQSGP